MGKSVFTGRSSVTALDMSQHQPLQDVRLDDTAELHLRMPSRPTCFRNIIHEILFVLTCSLAGATFVFLQRSLVVILESFQQDLRMTPSETAWVLAGPGLSTGALFLPISFIVQRLPLSRKYVLVGSLLVYSLLVGVCAASMDGVFLDAMCALAGITCALHVPTVISILQSAYPFPSSRKTVANTFFLASSNSTAIIVGSMLSGGLAVRFNWRASFVFLAVLFVLAALLVLVFVPNFDRRSKQGGNLGKEVTDEEDASESPPTKPARETLDFDWRGSLLLTLAIGLFSVALTSAPEARDGWGTPYVWLLFSISLVCLGLFVYWERAAQHPLVPRMVWDEPGLLATLLFTFLMSMAGCSLVFWVPLFIDTVQFKTSFETAMLLLPAAITGICISPLLSLVIHRMNHGLVAAVSAFCMIGSNAALFYLRADSNYWATTFPAMILSTIAMDWTIAVATALFSLALPLHYHTAGLGLVVTVARLAVPAGLGITTAIHTSFAGRSDIAYPEVPYTNVFYTTLSFSVLALTLVPFLNLDNKSLREKRNPMSLIVNFDPLERLDPKDFGDGPSFSIQPRISSLYAKQTKPPTLPEPKTPSTQAGPSNATRAGSQQSSTAGDRVIWLVCEECGASKRMVEQVGDPARYFYDGGESAGAEHRSALADTSSGSTAATVRKIPLCKDLNSLRG